MTTPVSECLRTGKQVYPCHPSDNPSFQVNQTTKE